MKISRQKAAGGGGGGSPITPGHLQRSMVEEERESPAELPVGADGGGDLLAAGTQ